MSASFRIDWHAVSDVGRIRKVNEDSFAAFPERGMWVVADGMGGHEGGDWASAQVTELIGAQAEAVDFDTMVERCGAAIHAANAAIWAESETRGAAMGTTVVALVMAGGRFAILWAGDSRAYLLRGGRLLQLTRDHSQVQELVNRGVLSPEDVEGHPMGHVLARAVGVQRMLELDAIADTVLPDDIFLLTSDGVHGAVAAAEIERLLSAHGVAQLPDLLVTRGMECGSSDNLTALVVGIAETTQLVLATPGAVA